MDLKRMQKEVWLTAEQSGWHPNTGGTSFGEFIALCHSEISEALEIYRKEGEETIKLIRFEKSKPEGVPIELADVMIRILDYAEDKGIDMTAAIAIKNEYNKTRKYRHGNKLI